MKADQERVRGLLTDTLSLICKSSLAYNEELRIEGVIGVTVDNSDVFIVHVNDAFGKDGLRKPHIIISGAESAQGNDVGDGIVSQNQPDGSISRRGRKRKTRLTCQGNVPPTATSEEQLAPVVVAETLSPGGESSAASVCRDKGLPGDLNDTTVTDHCASEERPAKRQNADNGDTSHDVLGSLVSAANLDGDNSYTINIMPNASTVADAWNTTANDSCSAENTAEHGSEQIVKLEQVSGDNIAYLDDSDNDTVDMSRDYGDASANLSSVLHKQSRRKTAASTLLNASSDAEQITASSYPAHQQQQQYTFELVEGATIRGGSKLYDNYGYSYVVRTTVPTTAWRCQSQHINCHAQVKEVNGAYVRNEHPHNHQPTPDEKLKDKLKIAARQVLAENMYVRPTETAKVLCDEFMDGQERDGDGIEDNLVRFIKREKRRMRLKAPGDNQGLDECPAGAVTEGDQGGSGPS